MNTFIDDLGIKFKAYLLITQARNPEKAQSLKLS